MATTPQGVTAVRRSWLPAALLALAAPLAGYAPHAPAQTWKPEKAIELIALNAPGGGADRILRIMASVLQERRSMNKPGGGGSVGLAYLNQHPGDAHYVVLSSRAVLTNNIVGQGPSYTVTSPARLTGVLAEVPTWREQGFNAVVSNSRSITGAKGMTEAQIAYWDQALRRMIDSDEWKKELEANFWTSEYMGSVETRKSLDRDNVQLRAFLSDLGLAR